MLFRALALMCALVVASVGAVAQDFVPAIEQINKFRDRSGDYRIVFSEDGFVVHGLDASADGKSHGSASGKQKVFAVGDKGQPVRLIQQTLRDRGILRSKPDGTFGPATRIAVQEFQHIVGLEEDGRVGKATWEALELPSLASTVRGTSGPVEESALGSYRFESAAWPLFLSELTQHGLVEYRIDTGSGEHFAVLSFRRSVSDQAWQGNGGIAISDQALDTLRLAEQFPPRASRDGRFIILVHEPHSDVAGHFQLIRGLDALVSANADRKFKFLVEGEFASEDTRDIDVRPTAAILSNDPGIRARQVHYLVRNFLIDSPVAYRLLYKDVPSRAIDDIAVRDGPSRNAGDALTNLTGVLKKHSKDPKLMTVGIEATPKKEIPTGTPQELRIALMAEEQSSDFGAMLEAIRKQAPGQFPDIEQALVDAKKSMDSEAAVWRLAYRRSLKMVEEIGKHFKGPESGLLPVAFIGSGHTGTMISKLPADIGYVVVEPRHMRLADDRQGENRRFDIALQDYKKAIKQAREGARKQAVIPPSWALPILREDLKRFESRDQAVPLSPPGLLDPDLVARLRLAVDKNPFIERAAIDIAGAGGSGLPPDGPFGGAFAKYSPDSGPHGRLTLLPGSSRKWDEQASAGWTGADRVSFIERVLVTKDETRTSDRAVFSVDPVTKKSFAAWYVAKERSYYLLDMSDKVAVASAFPQPKARELHQRVAEVLLRELGESPRS